MVNDRYRIERELGRGGIGVVYLARDLRLHDMPVVIKVLLDDSTQHAWLSKKFLQEAEALTRIHHPGVVRVIDRDRTADGRSFFVMEFVKGVSLRSAIPSTGLVLEFAAAIVRDLGQALSAAHREGVLHRDLKPENIMLETLSDGEQRAKLIDFGIAKVRDSREGASTELGLLAGSLYYLAPEQLLGAPASVASDIYAFAAVAYELLTGRRPFNPDAPHHIAAITQLMTLQRDGRIVPPQQLRPSVSAAAQAIVLRGLAFDPAARQADAREFGDGLAQALIDGSEPIREAETLPAGERLSASVPLPAVPPAPLPPPVAPPPERRRGWLVAIAVTAALAAATGLYQVLSRSSPAEPQTFDKGKAPERRQVVPERTLSYSVRLQRPGRQAIEMPGAPMLASGDRVHLTFTSPQGGHLYIFNESPLRAGSPRNVNILFPSPTSNGGSARLDAGTAVTIPGGRDGFVFRKEDEGVEKLWIVWSVAAQPDLEAMQRYANAEAGGEITDAADVARLDAFLGAYLSEPDAQIDGTATKLSAPADVFVQLVNLEHH